MPRFIPALIGVLLCCLDLPAQKPDLFILSVGVEQYLDTRLNLKYCADDARDLAAAIGKQNTLYTTHAPRVLTNAQASRAAIRQALSDLEREVTTDDLLVFVFSGHGIEDRLVTYDFNLNDQEASSLSKSDLLQRINKLGCGYLLLIDACHSGSFAKSLPGKDIREADSGNYSRALVDALAGSDKPYLIIGSSGSDQKSWECPSCGHGYFAQTILDALQNKTVADGARRFIPDGNGDGYISPYELDYYIKEAVRVHTAREESPQKVYSRLTMGASFPLFSLPGAAPLPATSDSPETRSSGISTPPTSELNWYTDFAKAQEASTASKKPIFGFFTGSDWCGWCKKLQADVFAKEAFVSWANKNVILLELDFPRRKQLPEEQAQQNQALAQAFKIQGYPTIWIFYATEDEKTQNLNLSALGSLGYPSGSVVGKEEVKFLEDANRVLANGKK